MKKGEEVHLENLERVMRERRVRPTVLLPVWKTAGFLLGAGTAMLGKEAAMACTVAVETVIGQHYNDQIRDLLAKSATPDEERELAEMFKKHRDDEMEHHEIGLAHGAEKAPLYTLLSQAIMLGCSAAIAVAKRI